MKKRYLYLEDIDTVETVETIMKKELLSIAEGLKNFTFSEHDDVISGYTKDGKFFYYDCTNFWSFKKSDIINAVSIVYSSDSVYYVYGDYTVNMYGVVNPTEDGETLIWTDGNIKEVDSADYTDSEETAEEPAADQAEEATTTLNNYDEVREALIESIADLETRKNRYQTDIYLYIDENGHGTIDTFANVGGNSWLNDDHITIYTDREHYETKLDDLQNGDGREASWNWLINELENAYNLTGIKEKIYNLCCDDDDDDPTFKSFDDLESYDIESALYALYCEEIDNYYKDYFIPDCCIDYIGEYADQALEKYR